MATVLSVDIEVLRSAVQSLNTAEDVLTDAMKAMSKDRHMDIGTKALNDAADSFQTRWKYGIERIGEAATATAEGISKCLVAYTEMDRAFAQALGQAESAVDATAARSPIAAERV
ncbi:hypothetical protein ACL02S_17245 [Nocardia sp. 004]|uniref:hypothetical protein n=1 Tax=Nocardia sp. 004 TaxID=3385978 RepID=UPI0039A1AB09